MAMRAFDRLFSPISLALVALAPSIAHGQQEQVPKELALALIPYAASEGGEIIVGKLPPDLATVFTLPSGGRVLGSFMTLGYGQSVIAVPWSADSAQSFVRRALVEHGWVARSPLGPRIGGLQYSQREAVPTTFCRPGAPDGLTITAQFHGRETLVRLTRNISNACENTAERPRVVGSSARAERVEFVQMNPRPYAPFDSLPPLWSPGDPISAMRTCRSESSSSGALSLQQQEQWLRSELSPDEILAYYGKQLDSAGWKPAEPNKATVTRTWAK
jgi:hypothetical protein